MDFTVVRLITFFFASSLLGSLIACTPTQRPLKNGQGYVVVPVSEKQFRIEYYLKNANQVESQWSATAGELCPSGFQVIYSKRHILNFDMYVPIAGNNVNLGRQEFIQYGQVVCNGSTSNTVALTESKWKEFNEHTRSLTPVSERWMTETLKIYVNHLTKLPISNSAATLEKEWGKPWKKDQRGSDSLSIWMKSGDSWRMNHISLIERNGCLHMVIVAPETSAIMATEMYILSGKKKSIEQLLFTGAVPAYFYRPTESCNP